MFSFNQ